MIALPSGSCAKAIRANRRFHGIAHLKTARTVVLDRALRIVDCEHDRAARFAVLGLPDAERRAVCKGELGAAPLVVDLGGFHAEHVPVKGDGGLRILDQICGDIDSFDHCAVSSTGR